MKKQYHLSGMGRRDLQKVMWFVGLPGYAGSDKKGTIASEEETYYSAWRGTKLGSKCEVR